jgi:hypothetical protein
MDRDTERTKSERSDHSVDGYRQGPRFGWLGALLGLVLLIVVAAVAYTVGVNAGTASGVAPGAVAPVYYGHWFYGGFGLFGFLFFFLILFLIFGALFRGRRWGGWHGGYGYYGRGPWGWGSGDPRDVPPPVQGMLEDWHRRAHGETPTGSAGGPSSTGPTPPDQRSS